MTLKKKIMSFTLAFIGTALILGLGVFYIFRNFGDNLEVLSKEISKDRLHEDLTVSILNLMASTKGWASSGNLKYRKLYNENLTSVREDIDDLEVLVSDRTAFASFEADFGELLRLSGSILSKDKPLGDDESQRALLMLEVQETAVFESLNTLHKAWLDSTIRALNASEYIRASMSFYLALLIAFGLLSSFFIIFLMRRVIEMPYKEMLTATERVASGDLRFRIGSTHKDEFGIIAERFDNMVESLEHSDLKIKRKLKETELFLEVARISGMVPELREALELTVQTVAEKMDKTLCAVFLYNAELKAFQMESCNVEVEPSVSTLSDAAAVSERAAKELKPFIIEDASEYKEIVEICGSIKSAIVAPLVRDHSCSGLLLIGSKEAGDFSEDELDSAHILSHTISNTLRNTELYDETKKQLVQLSMVYELSKALTTVYETDDLLRTITDGAVKLINAKGCIIRLLEDGMLKVKSFSGPGEDLSREMDLPIGKGVAGWVAMEGKPMFVEDISKMPDDIKAPTLATRSAISVPLKKEDEVIGTLGLYDKLDEYGNATSFSLDDLKVAEGFAHISAIAIDKTRMREEEVRARSAIQEARKRMDLLFESVQSGIITLDRSYTITAANKYIERWVDKPLEEIISANALDVFHAKGGICPHCAARATFEEGSVNTITQSSGLNYADLASYPVRDKSGEVSEAVVIIQDITDRVLYQEEIMGLYREVMQTKEYMESLISNSADAIVTTDVSGIVESWNPAAEAIFGFSKDEATGKFLPFIPESLMEFERDNIDKIKHGEVLKLETFRTKSDGSIIEVSVTLSPIKDVTGEIIGISGITRDITDKKRVEKELIRRNQELSRLFFISSAMRGTLELKKLLGMVLTTVTMSDGLGFNRAIIFFISDDRERLKGIMGVGPSNLEEAWRIWERLAVDKTSLHDIMQELEDRPINEDSLLNRLTTTLDIALEEDTVLTRVVNGKMAYNVPDVKNEPLSDNILIQQLGTEAYAAVPLISRDNVIGVLWADNLYNKKLITDEDMKFLKGFADQVASAIESARLFQQVSLAEAELENIFSSISDMVFFTSKDYTIRNINQAVADRIGMQEEEILGRKCYEIFHGMDEPWPMCPHHKTVETMKPNVEELEDPHLDGTFLTSTSPIFDTNNNFLGTVHVVRDISEIKALRERLLSAERMAALGEVAAKVAHEIRNPLVSVGGFAKRLESKLDGNLQEYARIISSEVRRLENILKDILGFVREVRISRKKVDLNDVVGNVIDLLREELDERGNTLTTSLLDPSVVVIIDPDRVKEAVLNVIGNANQATDNGNIIVSTRIEEGYGVLEVSDTGCGIREEDINRIFDPFFTTRPTGTGLGLAIAKRIVEEHSGAMKVKNNSPESGTTFTIYLPLNAVDHD
jgi:PAS domain S-box-containing protein